MFNITQLVKNIKNGTLTKIELFKRGGGWLGAARNWIQCNCVNGSDVTWGSHDSLRIQKTLTVSDIENFAARIALATLEEYKANLITDGEKAALAAYMNKENWSSYIKVEAGNLVCFQPNRDHMHFVAAYKHQNGWDIANIIDESYENYEKIQKEKTDIIKVKQEEK